MGHSNDDESFFRQTIWTNENFVSKDEWLSVLKISSLWRCRSLRDLAIRKLESPSGWSEEHPPPSAVEAIILGRKYFISRWVLEGYTVIASTGEITDADMEAIGAVESFKLMRINRGDDISYYSIVENTVKAAFQAELASITAAEKLFDGEVPE